MSAVTYRGDHAAGYPFAKGWNAARLPDPYTTPVARIVDSHCDVVLVGDSVGMVLHGLPTTQPWGLLARRRTTASAQPRPPAPWFLLAFIGMVVLNSVWEIPASLRSVVALLTTFLLSAGLAAMGLHANIHEIRSRGFRPLLLALSASVFVSCFSLVLIKLLD